MTIQFMRYPESNRVPGVYVEVDASKANTGQINQRSLLVGQVLAGSTLQPGIPVLCQGAAWTRGQAGAGSMLALMAEQYRNRDTFGELWLLPLLDDPAAVAAQGGFEFTGAATAAGTLSGWIGGQRVQAYVGAGATPAAMAAAFVGACSQVVDLPVTASVNAGKAVLSAKNKGAAGNDIDLRMNYLGARGGEATPGGVTVVVTAMQGGTTSPSLTLPLLNLAEQAFDYIALPYTDTASLDAMRSLMSDDSGRWAWSRMIYGHVFAALRGSIGALTTFGVGRNDQHLSVMGFADSPTPAWLWAADLTAACAASLRVDPALPVQTLLLNVLPPPVQSRFVLSDRNTLLYDGIATFTVGGGGQVQVERVVTTYQTNAAGAPDNSYLDVETLATLTYVLRDLRTYLSTQYARKKIVSDATRVTGNNVVSPAIIRASVISRYRLLESLALVQNGDAFAAAVQVEPAGGGLVKILWPGDLAGQLRQLAILAQFTKST